MSRKWKTGARVGMAMLGLGCAAEPTRSIEWYKAGAGEVERDRALKDCEAVTQISYEAATSVEGGEVELRGDFTSCMRRKGWVWGIARD